MGWVLLRPGPWRRRSDRSVQGPGARHLLVAADAEAYRVQAAWPARRWLVEQLVEHRQPIVLVAESAGQGAGADEPGVRADQRHLPAIAAQQQVFRSLGVVQVGIVQAQQHVTVGQQVLQRAAVARVGPVLGNDLQVQRAGGVAQLFEQKAAVLTVQHTNALGLRQQVARQAQLPAQRRIAPQQREERGPRLSQALFSLYPADPHGQGRRAGSFREAPFQCGVVQQDQALVSLELARTWQVVGGLEMYMVVRPAAFQRGDETANARLVFRAYQQDFAGEQRPHRPQAQQQQAQQQGHQNSSSALTLRRWRLS
ncbi:hypothetical protein O164_12185 [Pseudomonas taiwanensis SJ9]|uniref:Uncharacterized protein n=1 Tax=Pseudomonas taiwanensis SJ9 TaxID=1388762 RepID=V7DAU9_9PSED|nr:hypothetical protein O164_12185 [Pseudomonas taiwanensis SJ9]